jgi:hypothetical protein
MDDHADDTRRGSAGADGDVRHATDDRTRDSADAETQPAAGDRMRDATGGGQDAAGGSPLHAAGDVEALLRRYQPVAPPATLRGRIVQASAMASGSDAAAGLSTSGHVSQARVHAAAAGRAWPWLAAAAALLLCAVALRVGGDGLIARADARLPAASAVDGRRDAAVASVAETLGGDDIAWRAAAVLVQQDQERRNEKSAGNGDRQDAGGDMP